MDDKYFVRYNYKHLDEDYQYVCTKTSYSFGEMIKYLHYCKKYEVEFYLNENDENLNEEIKKKLDLGAFIEDFNVSFGTDICVPTIEVWLH